MRPEDRDLAYLWDMREAAKETAECMAGVSFVKFQSDRVLRRAVERQIEIVGEAARHVSPEFQAKHPEIPWKQVIGQRNILAHEYGEILVERIYSVATTKIPGLIAALNALIPQA